MLSDRGGDFQPVGLVLSSLESVNCKHTSKRGPSISPVSEKHTGLPSTSNEKLRIPSGVGEAAKGYCFGSRLLRWRGALRRRGGKEVVVVVVVVTTVVCVAGAYLSCPRAAYCCALDGRRASAKVSAVGMVGVWSVSGEGGANVAECDVAGEKSA